MNMKNNYSEKGWRMYIIEDVLKIPEKKFIQLEKWYDLEIYIEDNRVYVKDKYYE